MLGGTFIGNAFNGMFWEIGDQELFPADIQGGGPHRVAHPSRRLDPPMARIQPPSKRLLR